MQPLLAYNRLVPRDAEPPRASRAAVAGPVHRRALTAYPSSVHSATTAIAPLVCALHCAAPGCASGERSRGGTLRRTKPLYSFQGS